MADIEVHGTLFSVGEPFVVKAYLHKAQDRIASEVERKIHAFQSLMFRYDSAPPTGYAQRHIVNRDLGSMHLITDSGIVYGPWLEGTGSRNWPKTRFRGYAIFRRTTQDVNNRAVQLAMPAIKEMCEAMSR